MSCDEVVRSYRIDGFTVLFEHRCSGDPVADGIQSLAHRGGDKTAQKASAGVDSGTVAIGQAGFCGHDRVVERSVGESHARRLASLLARAAFASRVEPPAEMGLALVSKAEIRDLNRVHLGESRPTDVLAFPIDGVSVVPSGQPRLLGDVVICPEVAALANASLSDEIAMLAVHGLLHLLGHDHAEPAEASVMFGLQHDLLDRFYSP